MLFPILLLSSLQEITCRCSGSTKENDKRTRGTARQGSHSQGPQPTSSAVTVKPPREWLKPLQGKGNRSGPKGHVPKM